MKQTRRWVLIGTLLLIPLLLAGCKKKQPASSQHHQLKVVASTNVYAQLAQGVLGQEGKATAIVQGTTDPHDFEPGTETAHTVEQADLLIWNGIGYDDWMAKLAQKQPQVVAAHVLDRHDGENEHLFFDPRMPRKMITQIEQQARNLRPKQQKQFQKNAAAQQKKYAAVTNLADQARTNLATKQLNQKVAVSEPVFNDALKYMGYQVANASFANAIDKEVDPSPKAVRDLRASLEKREVAFFVDNTQNDSKVVRQMVSLAKKHQVPVIKITETVPPKQTYAEWMTGIYQQVLAVQKQEQG
ncbi:Zinc ABC transporter, periplasmic-binding protein ZnuA [Fructilactobacillus florum 8D]|uniref:Zinc ABC transporter, periplasmic-binding protein ZnuA n=1 Tax=Fructilactobacillus florum 8D TaxID=1221538 RepID=W9EIG4_9LACO|nr:zinc ABC transporter substrate-binding protein [Fructilactobacillus florum]EKK20589.1 Zinc ABC transporter, periplasmic-binding protein ZnuA [Fructilactobacillus florum 2F]ETO40805.1 Zinc ABC transporter, periplasmic-binding protein ZnuA [Fructilactobacillus florum 8D]